MTSSSAALVTLAFLSGCDGCVVRNPAWCCTTVEDCQPHFAEPQLCSADEVCIGHECLEPADASGPGPGDPDANRANPIVMFHQAADLVLGQVDLDGEAELGCVASAASATTIAADGAVLYVREDARNRVLAWTPMPATNGAGASLVEGSSQLTDCTPSTMVNGSTMGVGGHVGAGGSKLVASDTSRNRVMIWNPSPATSGAPATLVVGAPDVFSIGAGNGAEDLNCPAGVWTDGTRLVVADACNHRVLIWSVFPTATGEPATLVLGQPAFNMSQAPGTPSSTNLSSPVAVWSDGTRLAVADSAFHRVLIWATFPTTNGEQADFVLGQSGFSAGDSGLGEDRFNQPSGVGGNADALFISDFGNNRVMVFSPFPTATGSAAAFALGQADLSTVVAPEPASPTSLYGPRGIMVVDTKLWVADSNHKRTIRYALYPP